MTSRNIDMNDGHGRQQVRGRVDTVRTVALWGAVALMIAVTGESVRGRMVTTFVSENEHTFAYYARGADGKDLKWMEIVYVRQ